MGFKTWSSKYRLKIVPPKVVDEVSTPKKREALWLKSNFKSVETGQLQPPDAARFWGVAPCHVGLVPPSTG